MRESQTISARGALRGNAAPATTASPHGLRTSPWRKTLSSPGWLPSLASAEGSAWPTWRRALAARTGVPAETLDRLRRWRLETARAAGVPAYVVFHDSTLTAIAVARPASLSALLRVPGVGDAKLRRYGEEVLEVLRTP